MAGLPENTLAWIEYGIDRGVDMVHAALIFEGRVLTRADDRADYGERRSLERRSR